SFCSSGDTNTITYGYDKLSSEIYATNGDIKKTLKFKFDYTGNPSYSFDFFSNSPSIVADGRSLHDFTAYTTLKLNHSDFYFDCLYYDIKSKQNGMLVKEGVCGLNTVIPVNYAEYIEGKINDIEKDIDSLDTSLLVSGKIKYLPVVINHNANGLVYKIYESKDAFLNDNFSILVVKNNRDCEIFPDNPWIITENGKPFQEIEVKSELMRNGKLILINASPKYFGINKCLLFPAFSVNVNKAFFYDSSFNAKKSYLIRDDKINLTAISNDGKWCSVNYLNDKNKTVKGTMLCSQLNL
ncbi:hypothetical protein D9943_06335, partial [Salmonella enterica]|nr:hypothetical protein [Salmonella enterica]EHE8574784.1 hypothetical protein [Salmonella enterica]